MTYAEPFARGWRRCAPYHVAGLVLDHVPQGVDSRHYDHHDYRTKSGGL